MLFALIVRSGFGLVAAHFFSELVTHRQQFRRIMREVEGDDVSTVLGINRNGRDKPVIGLVVGEVSVEANRGLPGMPHRLGLLAHPEQVIP